jgi:hypothetical protein
MDDLETESIFSREGIRKMQEERTKEIEVREKLNQVRADYIEKM